MKPWILKYTPKTTKGIKGQEKALTQLTGFLKNFRSQKKKALLLHGPSGTGKTASVHASANELDFELMEVNASDFRNKEGIDSTVGTSISQMSLFMKEKLILLDEIDGLSGTKDRGGLQAITALIDKSTFPIVMTCNDPWDKKLSSLRKKVTMVEFHSLNYLTVLNILKDISEKESLKADDAKLKTLARRSGGDLRSAITDLQTISILGELSDIEELSERNRTDKITDALLKIFKTTDPKVALTAFETIDEDYDTIFLWLDENLPKEYLNAKDLARAYDKISKADVFKGRIRRWQYWRFLVYINQLLSAGVSLSKDERYKGFTKYTPTTRILKIWQANQKYSRRKAIAQKIADVTHTSSKEAIRSTLPFIQQMFRNNSRKAELIAADFDFDKDEIEWLKR